MIAPGKDGPRKDLNSVMICYIGALRVVLAPFLQAINS